jgi:hypothetical protein
MKARRQAQLATQRADLVLEQLAQRFDQLQAHLLGQAAHVVVRLDRHGGAAGKRPIQSHRVERALGEEVAPLDPFA